MFSFVDFEVFVGVGVGVAGRTDKVCQLDGKKSLPYTEFRLLTALMY